MSLPTDGHDRASSALAAASAALREGGRNVAADELARPIQTDASHIPSVLIAGEDKRGKSSLVNVLMGLPEMSPVGVEVVTGSPISFFHSPQERATILRYGNSTPEEVSVEDARRLATVQGNPQNSENIRAVQIGVGSELLKHMLLVDTPGVGGLNSGHAELTLQTLAFADALVFVVEAGAQFRGPELEFLKKASSRIETVILVMTKTDLHRGWRTILEDNLKVLGEYAPRFSSCPVVPTSAALALRGLRSPDPDDARELLDESGVGELQRVLVDHVVRRADALATVNRLRSAVGPLTLMQRDLNQKIAVLDRGDSSVAQMRAEQQRLEALNQEKAEWPRKLEREVRRITLERNEQCTAGMVEIRRRYDERIKSPKRGDSETLPGELIADITALAGRLNETSVERLMGVVDSVLDDLDEGGEARAAVARIGSTDLQDRLGTIGLGSTSLAGHDKLLLVSSFATGRSMGSLVSGSGLGLTAGAFIAPPIGIAIGLAVGALFAYQSFRGRSRQLFSQEFRTWMSEQCSQAQVSINTTFQREMIDIQEEIRDLVRQVLLTRERQIRGSIDEAKALLEQASAEKQKTREVLVKRRAATTGAKQAVLGLLNEFGVGVSDGGDGSE